MDNSLTEADRAVLLFLAEHRIVLTAHVAVLLGVSVAAADRRLRRLANRGLASHERIFRGLPAAAWIKGRGLRAIGSALPAPRVHLQGYRHDVGVGWLWLAARSGTFGTDAQVVSEREMRSSDARAGRALMPASYGVGVGGIGPTGLPKRHYPDLLVKTTSGRTLAIELELTRKSAHRLTLIMRGYAGDPRIDGVLYLVPDRRLGAAVRAAARREGIADLVHIQLLADEAPIEGAPTVGARTPQRRTSRRRSAQTAGRSAATGPRAVATREGAGR